MSVEARGPGAGLERTLHRDYYLSGRLFQLERERILYREWFCAAREEEIPNPGDYLVRDIAGESVLVVRTRDGGLAAHYNVCRHRGSQLVPGGGRGSFSGGIRCPYHAWTYTLEGPCAPRFSRRATAWPGATSPCIRSAWSPGAGSCSST